MPQRIEAHAGATEPSSRWLLLIHRPGHVPHRCGSHARLRDQVCAVLGKRHREDRRFRCAQRCDLAARFEVPSVARVVEFFNVRHDLHGCRSQNAVAQFDCDDIPPGSGDFWLEAFAAGLDVPCTLVLSRFVHGGSGCLVSGHWSLDPGPWTLDSGLRARLRKVWQRGAQANAIRPGSPSVSIDNLIIVLQNADAFDAGTTGCLIGGNHRPSELPAPG